MSEHLEDSPERLPNAEFNSASACLECGDSPGCPMFPCPRREPSACPTCRDEAAVVAALQQRIQGRIDWTALQAEAAPWVRSPRAPGAFLNAGIATAQLPDQQQRGPANFDAPRGEPAAGAGRPRPSRSRPTNWAVRLFDTDGDGPHQTVGRAGQLGHPVLEQLLPRRAGRRRPAEAPRGADRGGRHRAPSSCWAGSSCSGAASLKRRLKPLRRREATQLPFASTCWAGRTHRTGRMPSATSQYAAALRALARQTGSAADGRLGRHLDQARALFSNPLRVLQRERVFAPPRCCRASGNSCSSPPRRTSTSRFPMPRKPNGWDFRSMSLPWLRASPPSTRGAALASRCRPTRRQGARGHRT